MSKVKTTSEVIEEIIETGFITERQVILLKQRSNKAGKDLWDYDINKEILVTPEQGEKGLAWLKKQARKRNTKLNQYQIEAIYRAKPNDFVFNGFYNDGRYLPHFTPIYYINGLEYCYSAGDIVIL